MLRMGYLHEAFIAFEKSGQCGGGRKADVFSAYALFSAQRDNEAVERLLDISPFEMTPAETVAAMSLRCSLGLPVKEELHRVMEAEYSCDADRLVMSIFAYCYANDKEKAVSEVSCLEPDMFKDYHTYLMVSGEIYKLGLTEASDGLLASPPSSEPQKFMDYLNAAYATGYYSRLDDSGRAALWQVPEAFIAEKKGPKRKWRKCLASLCCMEYDRAEAGSDESLMKKMYDQLASFPEEEKETLYLAAYSLRHFEEADKSLLKKRLERLVKISQNNVRYRKMYSDFLRAMGLLKASDDVARATVALRRKEEKDEFRLLQAFHNFYCPDICMLSSGENSDEHRRKNCPVCFGSGFQPIIRSIGFGHSPADIFTENMEKRFIEANEDMLKRLFDWQPMNVSSPIVNRYLHSLGAYMSSRPYPDVLVPGQTYIYLQMKTSAYKRLASEGYSLTQIDPLLSAMNAAHPRKELSIFSENGRELSAGDTLPVSAEDFVIEIIHAISPQDIVSKYNQTIQKC